MGRGDRSEVVQVASVGLGTEAYCSEEERWLVAARESSLAAS